MEYRNTWKILESTIDQIEVISSTAHRRVGMEARKHGIAETPVTRPITKMNMDGNARYHLSEMMHSTAAAPA